MTKIDLTTYAGLTGEVTALDIGNGQPGSCTLCPIALALERMFPGYEVYVEINEATIHKGDAELVRLRISEPLSAWMDAYDSEETVSPVKIKIYTWNLKGYKYMLDIGEAVA